MLVVAVGFRVGVGRGVTNITLAVDIGLGVQGGLGVAVGTGVGVGVGTGAAAMVAATPFSISTPTMVAAIPASMVASMFRGFSGPFLLNPSFYGGINVWGRYGGFSGTRRSCDHHYGSQ